jgi:methylmalonyl-CoA mutase
MASEELLRLAADFDPATADRWHELVDKVLRGRSFDDVLVAETYDGLAIQPLYGPADGPGAEPSGMVRGTVGDQAVSDALGGDTWDIRQRHGHPDPTVTNQRILRDLERGVTSIELLPVGMATVADLERTLEGVMLDLAPIALRPGPDFIGWAGALLGLLARRGADPASTVAMIGADPLGVMATHLMTPWPIDAGLAYAADLAAHTAERWPGVRALRADGAPFHNAGASDAQELAYVVAALVTYLRSLEGVGLDPARAATQINLTVVATADQFLTIAKIRALRRMLARVFDAAGAAEAAGRIRIDAITSAAMMTSRDPWVNMLRTTVACFGAAVAGVDSVTVLPFDLTTGLPDDLGLRMARNTQLVLQEESRVGVVADPAGGSWYVEDLTERLAADAWRRFQEVEAAGGLPDAIGSGAVAEAIGVTAAARRAAVATRRQPITGVSEFPFLDEEPLDRPMLAGWRESARDPVPVELPGPGDGRLTEAAIAAMSDGAAVATVTAALAVGPTANDRTLSLRRWAEPYESLRAAAEAAVADDGSAPSVFVVTLGPVPAHNARAGWIRNLLASGGIRSIDPGPVESAEHAVQAFRDSRTRIAAIASSDEWYAEHAAAVASALKGAGAKLVLLAGNPGDHRAAWTAAGVDRFAHVGVDVLDLLGEVHRVLEVNPS